MFKILGADGKEYGPVTVDQIKRWIAEGRANRETMAQQTGDSNWRPLDQFADFTDVLGGPPPVAGAVPPPAGISAPVAPAATTPVPVPRTGAEARARAQQAVSGPAICLMVVAGLGLVFGLIGLLMSSMGGSMPPMPGLDPDVLRFIEKFTYGPIAIATKVISLAISALILFGAIRMQQLTSHGLAMAVAIIAMIPCFSPCCLLGIPFGIWTLVVLSRPDVRSQFK
jgi:hypothetical protein